MKSDWYSPTSFMPDDRTAKFSANQIDWIAEYYEVITDGTWPIKSSGYIDNPFAPPAGRTHAGAYFETPTQVLAEFHKRIDRCGADGAVFLCIRCLEYDQILLMKAMSIDRNRLNLILAQVFKYIQGRWKKRSYTEFKKH